MQNAIMPAERSLDMAGHPNTQLIIAMHPDNNPANKRNFTALLIGHPFSAEPADRRARHTTR
jgi:hypothetical protein